jgi:type IV pilus assembly protein PilP
MCVLLVASPLLAAEDVIYKDPKPLRGSVPEKQKELLPSPAKDLIGSGYVYDPRGKTDPFKPFITELEGEEEEGKKKKPKTYLETLDLSQLELTAIIVSPKGNFAMVRDSKGLGYVIREGTPVGTKGGVVHEVKEREVVIREEYRDFRGDKKTKDVTKKLYD